MTIKHVQEASLIDSYYVVSIPNHKTLSVHGPVNIVLTKTLHSWLVVFINAILPVIPQTASDTVYRS